MFFLIFVVKRYYFWNKQDIYLNAPRGVVHVAVDQYGIPHISSTSSDADLFYALGYMHARDRLWQMIFQKHVVQGRLSELFGKATISEDKYLRVWGFYRASRKDWKYFSPRVKALIHAYTKGVNYYINNGYAPLQLILLNYKPEPWTDIDSIAWGKMMAWNLQNMWKKKLGNDYILRHFPKPISKLVLDSYDTLKLTTLSDRDLKIAGLYNRGRSRRASSEIAVRNSKSKYMVQLFKLDRELRKIIRFYNFPGKGSNAWVLSGNLTKTGKPIISNDIHLSPSLPNTWYLVSMNGPSLKVIGATIPGLPAVIVGHNKSIGWGVTNAAPDVQDVYRMKKHSNIITMQSEKIKVRGMKQAINYRFHDSRIGPVVSDLIGNESDNFLVIRWPALISGDTTLQSFIKLDFAQDWHDFKDALHDFVAPSLNFIYADVRGNIGYYLPGRIPIRNSRPSRFTVSYNKANDWLGYIPFEKLPHSYNPPENFIISANNTIATKNYLYSLRTLKRDQPFREWRIQVLLHKKNHYSLFDLQKIQSDDVSYLWFFMKQKLISILAADPNLTYYVKLFERWDGSMKKTSLEATLFAAWYEQLRALVPKPKINYPDWPDPLLIAYLVNTRCGVRDHVLCNRKKIRKLFLNALQQLNMKFGVDLNQWSWGEVHKINFIMQGLGNVPSIGWLWNVKIGSAGGNYTVNAASYDENFNQKELASYRENLDFSNLDHSTFVIPLGESENVLSHSYKNFLSIWQSNEYVNINSGAPIDHK